MSKSKGLNDVIKDVADETGMNKDLVEQFLLDRMLKDLGTYIRAKKKVNKILNEALIKASQ